MLCYREQFHRFIFLCIDSSEMYFLDKNPIIGKNVDVFEKRDILHRIEWSSHSCCFCPFCVTDEYYIIDDGFSFYKERI